MTKARQEVNSQIADNLKDCYKDLEFKYDDDSCSFNILDGKRTGKGYRHIRHYNEEDEKVPLDGVEPEETLNTEVSAASFNGDGYVILTSNLIDIPLLHAWGVSYLATCNDAIISDYVQELENIQVIYTCKSDAEIEIIRNFFDLGIQIIKVDFDGICPGYSEEDPLTTVAEKIQESGENGLDTINKFIYKTYRGYMDKTTVKSPEVFDTSDSQNTTSKEVGIDIGINTTETNVRVAEQKNIKSLPIESLISDKKYQFRDTEDPGAIKDLSFAYKKGEVTAAIEVVATGDDKYIIVDGNHRYKGAKEAGLKYVDCIIVAHGSTHDAFKLSLGANYNNKALRRSYKDMRKAVHAAIYSKEFRDLSNRKISDICKVSSSLVDKIKKELAKDDVVPKINSAHVGTSNGNEIKEEKPDDTEAHSHVDKPKSTSPRKKTKAFSEKIKNESLTIVVTAKSGPNNQESYQGLLTDLQNVIDDYISDFKEAI